MYRLLKACGSPPTPPSSSKHPLLHRAENGIGNGAEGKGEREPDVAAVRGRTAALTNGADEPDLRHAEDGAHDTETKRHDGGDARRK